MGDTLGYGHEPEPEEDVLDLHCVTAYFRKAWAPYVNAEWNLDRLYRRGGLDEGDLDGLSTMFKIYPETKGTFFRRTLPFIIQQAGMLEERLPAQRLDILRAGVAGESRLSRLTVLSLLAHMFLGTTLQLPDRRSMPQNHFCMLLRGRARAEVAKLRMFVEYFDAVLDSKDSVENRLQGELRIYRRARAQHSDEDKVKQWTQSRMPILAMGVENIGVGFEDGDRGSGCIHADFANMCLGGGVLTGGCVQEEIRFAICPELCAAMLICPVMEDHEAIFVVGAEQFSRYDGYAYRLAFAGRHTSHELARDPVDGTPLVAIAAMDAIDYRFGDRSLQTQMQLRQVLRELEKAAAAFTPFSNEGAENHWPTIATGNWGCGAFGGYTPLKAIIQWLAASEGGRTIRYFPFDEEAVGLGLKALSRDLVEARVTVGQLFKALGRLRPSDRDLRHPEGFFTKLRDQAVLLAKTKAGPGQPPQMTAINSNSEPAAPDDDSDEENVGLALPSPPCGAVKCNPLKYPSPSNNVLCG